MERCDFSSVITTIRKYISDAHNMNQLDLMYDLFVSFLSDEKSLDFTGSINFGVGRNQRLFFLSIKKRDIGKNFRYNKITTNYRKEISLCPLLILSYLFSI